MTPLIRQERNNHMCQSRIVRLQFHEKWQLPSKIVRRKLHGSVSGFSETAKPCIMPFHRNLDYYLGATIQVEI